MFRTFGSKARIASAVLCLSVVAGLSGLADAAQAASGRVSAGVITCEEGYVMTSKTITYLPPSVIAANVTSSVDSQWVRWRAEVVDSNYQPVTTWSPWKYVVARDNAWTSAFADYVGSTASNVGAGYYFDITFGSYDRFKVWNAVQFYNGSYWESYITFFSRAGSGAASGTDGAGYC